MSTTIHHLHVHADSTLDEDGTASARQWQAALGAIRACPGWRRLVWGRHLETPERVILMIDWHERSVAREFLDQHEGRFAHLVSPLLVTNLEPPHAVDVNITGLEPRDDPTAGVTTVYRYTFTSLRNEERIHLGAHTFNDYLQILDHHSSDLSKGYRGGDAGWAVDRQGDICTDPLYIMLVWDELESELSCERNLMSRDGTATLKETVWATMLAEADPGGERFHVRWEALFPDGSEDREG